MRKSTLNKLLAAAFIAAATLPAMAADTIKIGVAGPHTGDLAPYGLPTKDAAELIVAEINAKGGVNGKKVELMVGDDHFSHILGEQDVEGEISCVSTGDANLNGICSNRRQCGGRDEGGSEKCVQGRFTHRSDLLWVAVKR